MTRRVAESGGLSTFAGQAAVSVAPKIFVPTDLAKRNRPISISCFEFLLRILPISFLRQPRFAERPDGSGVSAQANRP
jgi:hypothetical protein